MRIMCMAKIEVVHATEATMHLPVTREGMAVRTACWMRAREVAGRGRPVACHAAAARLQTLQPPGYSTESIHKPCTHQVKHGQQRAHNEQVLTNAYTAVQDREQA